MPAAWVWDSAGIQVPKDWDSTDSEGASHEGFEQEGVAGGQLVKDPELRLAGWSVWVAKVIWCYRTWRSAPASFETLGRVRQECTPGRGLQSLSDV